ncbi:SRPBCC family protein [Larkinella sp. C7]|jgi:hypothetical protein|uniref:SRPBCC family protein n=1 Tax=Larkinella sp. C7 TaxID=2576607 RepID=UPI00111105A7|nr:SRPBCC family protein [Larkinella sp. C7]
MASFSSIPHSILLTHSVLVEAPAMSVFHLLLNLDRCYLDLSTGHRKFDILNGGPLKVNSTILCEEVAGNQEVFHTYVVEQLIENQLLYYVSKPSISYVNGQRKRPIKSTTYVQFELDAIAATQTRVRATIVIQFSSGVTKFLAQLTGTRKLWQAHVREETDNLKKVVERSFRQPAGCRKPVLVNPASAGTI